MESSFTPSHEDQDGLVIETLVCFTRIKQEAWKS